MNKKSNVIDKNITVCAIKIVIKNFCRSFMLIQYKCESRGLISSLNCYCKR